MIFQLSALSCPAHSHSSLPRPCHVSGHFQAQMPVSLTPLKVLWRLNKNSLISDSLKT